MVVEWRSFRGPRSPKAEPNRRATMSPQTVAVGCIVSIIKRADADGQQIDHVRALTTLTTLTGHAADEHHSRSDRSSTAASRTTSLATSSVFPRTSKYSSSGAGFAHAGCQLRPPNSTPVKLNHAQECAGRRPFATVATAAASHVHQRRDNQRRQPAAERRRRFHGMTATVGRQRLLRPRLASCSSAELAKLGRHRIDSCSVGGAAHSPDDTSDRRPVLASSSSAVHRGTEP